MANKKTVDLDGYGGLDYIRIKDIPARDTKVGRVMNIDLRQLELCIVAELVLKGVPLRGAEVKFIRKAFGFSQSEFASQFKMTAPAITKWESDPDRPLKSIAQYAVRMFSVFKLKLEFEKPFHQMIDTGETPNELEVRWGEAG
jgi:DNA-binding transcriptional regulator YiaG